MKEGIIMLTKEGIMLTKEGDGLHTIFYDEQSAPIPGLSEK